MLRLILLASTTNNGLPRRSYDALRLEFLHTYGHEHLLTLINLEKAGLVRPQAQGRGSHALVKKAFRLIVNEEPLPVQVGAENLFCMVVLPGC